MFKVVSFGEILIDFLSNKLGPDEDETLETFTKFPGGAPANVAVAVAKLGGESYFVGKIATDMFGEFLTYSLKEMGVKTDYLTYSNNHKTALAFVSLDQARERSFEFYRENTADLNFEISDFKTELFKGPGIFHCCSNTLTEQSIFKTTIVGLGLAKKAGWLISFDVNLRLNLWRDEQETLDRIRQCIKFADVVKLSKEELDFITGNQERDAVIDKILSEGCGLVIVTDGHNPLNYYTKDGKEALYPPSVNIVDSTAAGDAFVGGFLYMLAKKDISPEALSRINIKSSELIEYLNFACLCGAFAVTRKGAFTALAEHKDIIKFLGGKE